MKARREKSEQDVIEEEHRLAKVKLGDTLGKQTVIRQEEDDTKTVSGYERIEQALEALHLRGCNQFTANEVRELCGMSRKYVYTLLMRLESEGKITILRKASSGNIYTFPANKQDHIGSLSIETDDTVPVMNNDMTDESLSEPSCENVEPSETGMATSECYSIDHIIHVLQDGITENNDVFEKTANLLIKYLKTGKHQFKVTEISEELGLHVSYIRAVMMWCRKKNLIEVVARKHKVFTYAFRVFCRNIITLFILP